jgi:hypothetical protein
VGISRRPLADLEMPTALLSITSTTRRTSDNMARSEITKKTRKKEEKEKVHGGDGVNKVKASGSVAKKLEKM